MTEESNPANDLAKTPFLTVDFGTPPWNTRDFWSLGEIKDLIGQERKAWEWLIGRANPRDHDDDVRQATDYQQRFERLATAYDHTRATYEKEDSTSEERQSARKKLSNSLRNELGKGYIPSDSSTGEYLKQVKHRFDDKVATFALAFIDGKRTHFDDRQLGAMFGVLGMPDRSLGAANVAVENVIGKCNEQLAAWMKQCSDFQTEFAEQLNEFQSKSAGQLTENKTTIQEETEELGRLQGIYKSIQELREPGSYWDAKRQTHLVWTVLSAIAAVLAAGGGGYLLIKLSLQVKDSVANMQDPSVWQVLAASFPTVVGAIGLFWLLRVLVRIFLSNLHLGADAAERVVMVKTFLAILEARPDLDRDDKAIIFSQLFRHSSTGFIRDDAAPPIPTLERITRVEEGGTKS